MKIQQGFKVFFIFEGEVTSGIVRTRYTNVSRKKMLTIKCRPGKIVHLKESEVGLSDVGLNELVGLPA